MKIEFQFDPSIGSEKASAALVTPGSAANAGQQVGVEPQAARLGPLFAGQRESHGEQMVRLETGLDARDLAERAHHQARAGEQHERQRHFDDHEAAAQTMRAGRCAGRAAARQRRLTANAGRLKRGKGAEDDAADGGRGEREETGGRIDSHFVEARGALGRDRDQDAQEPDGQHHAQHAADGRHQRALGQHLQRQAQASAAERGADGELVLARGAARDQQIGDVDAGHEQQAADGAEQDEQRETDLCHQPGGERFGAYRDAAIGVGVFALQVEADRGHLPRGRLHA